MNIKLALLFLNYYANSLQPAFAYKLIYKWEARYHALELRKVIAFRHGLPDCVVQSRRRGGRPLLGSLDMGQYQQTFKAARERTSSLPAGLHYTIWKAMTECDYLTEFQCVMLSLPFIYGFVWKRWLKGIDVMIEKKEACTMDPYSKTDWNIRGWF